MEQSKIKKRKELIEKRLNELIPQNCYPQKIHEAMRYSLLAGGKRIRPIFFISSADAVGVNGEQFLDAACALEMIHTYSLIHDDLPAMDNDDYRRGRLANHKFFGEGIAILAGDGLLTLAFKTLLLQPKINAKKLNEIAILYADCAGSTGMIGGQILDIENTNKVITDTELEYMHQAKTAQLFRAALIGGVIAAGGDETEIESIDNYAKHYGLAFQITDDILDVISNIEKLGKPIGSDKKNLKNTYVSRYGINKAKKLALEAVQKAQNCLTIFNGNSDFLKNAVEQLLFRKI